MEKDMMELLNFTFASGAHFAGVAFLLWLVGEAIGGLFKRKW